MNTPILEFVLQQLAARTVPWTQVSREAGIPYDTLKKIARGVTPNPGVQHVQALHDYFKGMADRPADAALAAAEKAAA